ncbi:tetratricopeptide repeat protein [Brevibacillus choshinensis]|uniref:S-layer homology domain-containing protein n=1 Tax=Brevibacillus choshinensis TaxID=54911 RepID=A0ABX7FTM0_BRECH|nr:S-layer homology domain-containing protein [Brevibacillus choshinensis]QRG69589.1 S-layer homology domain-containing protein [Brevibacillus choshinensis]
MQKLLRTISCTLLAATLMTPGFASAAGGFMPYGDISKHWAKTSIIRGVQAGLFAAGSKAPLFYPNRDMTRAEFVALLDRLYNGGQYQLYPLTFLSEHAEWNRGEGFEEPYLPYKDVDRLTWMYAPTLRVSYIMERLYGPDAIQQVFPGEQMKPNQPITHEEAAKLMQMFTMTGDSQNAWGEVSDWGWIEGERTDSLKRGEAAVAADRLMTYLMQDTILPLLDFDGSKFPMVPEIQELFPLFVTYTDSKTADEETYVNAVEAIRNHEDTDETYAALSKLAGGSFSNQIGVHFYLSWNPTTPLTDNLDEAFRAIDAYFQDKIILPDTLRLLSANVYDIALQLGASDTREYDKVLTRLGDYEKKLKQDTKEWESLSIYLGALEIKAGHTDKALERYGQFASKHPEALLNSAYYLVQEGRTQEAEALIAAQKPKASDERMVQLVKLLGHEMTSIKDQSSIATDLAYTLNHLDRASSYQVKGEAFLSGFSFTYTQDVDGQRKASRTSGFYQSPQKLVSDKLETYTDGQKKIQYTYDTNRQAWDKHPTDTLDFVHEWVGSQSIRDRLANLHARYYKQSFGRYDIITEWIPGSALEEKAKSVTLGRGKIKNVPLYMNKYYIDRTSDELVMHVWRYEEIYDSKEYVAYSGTDHYNLAAKVKVFIPDEVRKEVTP